MQKIKQIYFYVQALEKNCLPQIVHHTVDEKKKEFYYKFLDKKKAVKLMQEEKKLAPDVKFRIVKLTETYESNEWL